jgi:hypothetical protein
VSDYLQGFRLKTGKKNLGENEEGKGSTLYFTIP